MADGIDITPGSGKTVLTDDTGAGGHAQVMKLAISTDGSGTLIPADASNGLDVDVTRVSGTVTVDSELPSAAALADGASNPTAPTVGSATLVYNGTTWDRARGDTTSGMWVNVKSGSTTAINGHVPGTNADQLGKAEDSGASNGDTIVAMGVVRQSEANSLTSSAGSDGDYAFINADARGLIQVVARPYVSRIRVASSGLSTGAGYAIGDTAGTIMTFAGCARVSGGTGTILAATLLDKGDVGTDYRLHIFRASVTLSTDNLAWAVSDSDQESLIGVVTMPSLLDVGANRVATLANIGLPYDCAATSLFVGIETRTANGQYAAATDLNLILTVALD